MPVFYGAIDLGKNELRNAVIQNLGAAPASPVKGQVYFDSTANIMYYYNGTAWISTAGTATPPATTTSLGTIQLAGVLAGTATAPTLGTGVVTGNMIADGTITDIDVAVTNKDGAAATPSLRTIGGGSQQAMAGNTRLDTINPALAPVSFNNQRGISLADPTAAQDAATKNYVDNSIQGLDAKASVKAASTANLTLSAPQTVDGIALVAGDRVLVKDQTTAANNGIYVVQAAAWTRAPDMANWTQVPNAFTWVEQGTVNADTGWVSTADQGGTLGTTAITWTQFSGSQVIQAGNGLTKTGNVLAVGAGTGILVSPGTTAVDTSVIATVASVNTGLASKPGKFAGALNGTASPETITHNLNTRDVQVTVLNGASPYTAVEVDWDATTVNTVTIRYNPNLGAGYRIVVVG